MDSMNFSDITGDISTLQETQQVKETSQPVSLFKPGTSMDFPQTNSLSAFSSSTSEQPQPSLPSQSPVEMKTQQNPVSHSSQNPAQLITQSTTCQENQDLIKPHVGQSTQNQPQVQQVQKMVNNNKKPPTMGSSHTAKQEAPMGGNFHTKKSSMRTFKGWVKKNSTPMLAVGGTQRTISSCHAHNPNGNGNVNGNGGGTTDTSSKKRYSRTELESLRFVNVEEQARIWNQIYLALGPVVARLLDEMSDCNYTTKPPPPPPPHYHQHRPLYHHRQNQNPNHQEGLLLHKRQNHQEGLVHKNQHQHHQEGLRMHRNHREGLHRHQDHHEGVHKHHGHHEGVHKNHGHHEGLHKTQNHRGLHKPQSHQEGVGRHQNHQGHHTNFDQAHGLSHLDGWEADNVPILVNWIIVDGNWVISM